MMGDKKGRKKQEMGVENKKKKKKESERCTRVASEWGLMVLLFKGNLNRLRFVL